MDPVYQNDKLDVRDYDEPDLDAWFLVSGDMDDFIFYGEPDYKTSEK